MPNSRAILLVISISLLCCSGVFAQQPSVAYNPGPSLNVKTFGAYGDMQFGSGGTNPSGTTLTSSAVGVAPFSASDMGKIIWIDKALFPAPILAGFLVTSSCTGTGKLTNNRSYPLNVYYRIAYTGSAGVGEVSVEGFAQLPASTSNACAKITGPGNSMSYTGISGYKVYFASDAPLRWASGSYGGNATVLDSNGNVEWTKLGGASGATEPAWTTTVGNMTTDNGITWVNEGPSVPGLGSGAEVYQSPTSVCGGSSDPGVNTLCEIDTIQSGSAPPSVNVFNGGAITSVNTSTNTVTFMNTLGTVTIQGNNYAWGHDDTTAISNSILAMQGLSSGGTLFFPVSSGCYGVTSTIHTPTTGGSFLTLNGEGSASSQQLGGPGLLNLEQRPSASCIATIGSSAGFTFPGSTSQTNAGPTIERLGFIDPFGSATSALTFFTNASTRVVENSFQGYAAGTAIFFNAQQTQPSPPNPFKYNQFVQVSDNVCISVLNCIVMNNGATNPAWIERNRCVSAQTGGGRCIQLGPNLLELPQYSPPYNAGATNWIVENFALYFPVSYESIDQYADYWIGNSNQQTASLQMQGNQNIVGGSGTGTALHVGASASGTGLCHDNEIVVGNNSSNAVGLFIDPQCSSTLHMGYTMANTSFPVEDFGLQSTFWNQELGTTLSAIASVNPLNVNNQSGKIAFQVLANGNLGFAGNSSTASVTIDSAATAPYNFILPTSVGTAGYPLLSGGASPLSFSQLNLSTGVTGQLPVANGGTNITNFAFSGTTHTAASVNGTTTSTHVATWDASGNLQDGGAILSGSGTGLVYCYCQGQVGSANATTYTLVPAILASGQGCTTTGAQELPIPVATTVKNLFVTANVAGSNSSSGKVTFYKNGSATTLLCTLGTGLTCNDTTHTVSLATTDTWSIRVTTAATNDATQSIRAVVQMVN